MLINFFNERCLTTIGKNFVLLVKGMFEHKMGIFVLFFILLPEILHGHSLDNDDNDIPIKFLFSALYTVYCGNNNANESIAMLC